MRTLLSILIAACLTITLTGGCATYVTPGGPAKLDDINRSDIAAIAARKPAANFPARLAIVRVQAPGYRSHSNSSYGQGSFSVVTTQELATEPQLMAISQWPSIATIVPISRLLLPEPLKSVEDLRLAAAKVQADILLIYTLDTTFHIQGRGFAPLSILSLGTMPDRDVKVISTASAIFVDMRTGFVYGVSEATSQATSLTNAWGSSDTVDRKRLDAEQQAFSLLLTETEKTWSGVVHSYAKQVK